VAADEQTFIAPDGRLLGRARASMVVVSPHVDLRAQRDKIVLWSIFNLLAAVGFAALAAARLCMSRRRRNWVLLNLEVAFLVAGVGQASLTWTGHVMDPDVPFTLCLVSGAFNSSISVVQTGSAFALTCRASARAHHPSSADG
jgi:hypothetical protein